MKVALLTLEYPPNVYGGAGVHVDQLSRALAGLLEVEVRTLDVGKVDGPPGPGLRVKRYRAPFEANGSAKPLEVLAWNATLVADPIDAQVVHAHTWYTDFAGKLTKELYGIPLVATVHSLEPLRPWKEEQLGRGYHLSAWMERTGLEACDRIIAVSAEMKQDIAKVYGIPGDRIVVIHSGVDADRFRPVRGPRTLAKYGVRKPYVLFLGRLSRQKGIFDLLEASAVLPKNLQVVCVTGKADTLEVEREMASRVEGLGNVMWINRMLPWEETVRLYTDCEAFVCPSLYEPFGIINLEAMACARPVVASAVGGIKEVVVEGETGVLVPPGQPAALAEAILRVVADPEAAATMGRAGRRRVEEKFTWDAIAKKTLNLYESLL